MSEATLFEKPATQPLPTTEGAFIGRLSMRFAAPEYAFLAHVRNQTGFSKTVRTADGIAMSLYPSRGLHLTGFEIKCNRGDWKRELADPKKADDIGKHCHFWVIVAPDAKTVPIEELPSAWGLLVAHGAGLKYAKQPLLNEHAQPPSYAFLAGILRNVSESTVPRASIHAQIAQAKAEGHKTASERDKWHIDDLKGKVSKYEEAIKRFTLRSGINPIEDYRGPQIRNELELAQAMRGEFGRAKLNELDETIRTLQQVVHNAKHLREYTLKNLPEPEWSI